MRAFLFYIDDWLSSKNIARMDAAEERGFLRLLLYAATEPDCGLPTDPDELADISLLGTKWGKPTQDESKRFKGKTAGAKILECFFEENGRYYNKRLLKEFNHQREVSQKRSLAGKQAVLARGKRSPIGSSFVPANVKQMNVQTDEQNTTNDVWACVSSPVISISKKEPTRNLDHGQRFEEWWGLWSGFMGTNHHGAAAHAWLSVVTPDVEDELFECTASYRDSRRNAGGYNPENFLFDQARDKFKARWPPVRDQPRRRMSISDPDFWGGEAARQ